MRALHTPIYACALLASTAMLPQGHAGADRKRVGVEAGFSAATDVGGSAAGVGGALSGAYEVSDAVRFGAQAAISAHELKPGNWGALLSQSLSCVYMIDVLQVVPYVGGGVGAYEFVGPRIDTQVKGGLQLIVGMDYIASRDVTLAFELRAHFLPLKLLESLDNPSSFLVTTFARVDYTWGWF